MPSRILEILIIVWPAVVLMLALVIHRHQNSASAWAGGPISRPKSLWLSFTMLTWFFLPIFIAMHPDFPPVLFKAYVFHLISWWVRGALELLMIYRWMNWRPRYGIGHDLFHAVILVALYKGAGTVAGGKISILAQSYLLLVLYSTLFEAYFAWRFKSLRSREEEMGHVYFAGDGAKWRVVNRLTLAVVLVCLGHLTYNSWLLL